MEKVAKMNGWVYAMVAALLIMALTNAVIHVMQGAWADVIIAISLVMILLPTPNNLRFINTKLTVRDTSSTSIQTLHVVAAVCLVLGLLAKTF